MIARRSSAPVWRWIAAAVVVVVLVPAAPAHAQLPMLVTIAGELLWVSGDRMMVSTRGGPVQVDLTEIPLDEYLALEPGAAVLVRGMWTEGDLLVASSLKALPGVLGPTGQLLRSLVTAAGGPMQLTTAENLVGTWTGRWEAAEGGPEGSLGLVVARVPGREAVLGQFTFVSGAMSRTLRYEGQLENGAVRFPLVDDGRIVLEAAGGSDRTLTADRLSGTWVEHRGALPAPRGTIELERAS